MPRCICQRLLPWQTWFDPIVGKYVYNFDGVRHRLHSIGVDLAELIDIADDLPELIGHGCEFSVRQLQSGQQGDLLDIRTSESHCG